jgi:membrane protease subunit (stomatin/prohibitin family)
VIDPIALYRNFVPPDIATDASGRVFDLADENLKAADTLFSGFVGSFAAALSAFTKGGKSIDDIQGGAVEFARVLNQAVEDNYQWGTNYGISVVSVQPRGLDWDETSIELVNKYSTGALMGGVAGTYAQVAVADGMKKAGETGGGAGMMGIGMVAGAQGAGLFQNQPGAAPAAQQQPPAESPMAALSQLKQLLDAGLIEQADFDAKKADILARL